MAPYGSPEEAQAALDAEAINAYYVIPAGYADTHQAELLYYEQPPFSAMGHFEEVVRANLVVGQTPALAERLPRMRDGMPRFEFIPNMIGSTTPPARSPACFCP